MISVYQLLVKSVVNKATEVTSDVKFSSSEMVEGIPVLSPDFSFSHGFSGNIADANTANLTLSNEEIAQFNASDFLSKYQFHECYCELTELQFTDLKVLSITTRILTGVCTGYVQNGDSVTLQISTSLPKYGRFGVTASSQVAQILGSGRTFNARSKGQQIGFYLGSAWAALPIFASNLDNNPAYFYATNWADVNHVPMSVWAKATPVNGVSNYVKIGDCISNPAANNPLTTWSPLGVQGCYEPAGPVFTNFCPLISSLTTSGLEQTVFPMDNSITTGLEIPDGTIPFINTRIYLRGSGFACIGGARLNIWATPVDRVNFNDSAVLVATSEPVKFSDLFGANLPTGAGSNIFSIEFTWSQYIILDWSRFNFFIGVEGVRDGNFTAAPFYTTLIGASNSNVAVSTCAFSRFTGTGSSYSETVRIYSTQNRLCYQNTVLQFARENYLTPGGQDPQTGQYVPALELITRSEPVSGVSRNLYIPFTRGYIDSLDAVIVGKTVNEASSGGLSASSPSLATHTVLQATRELIKRWNGSAWVSDAGTVTDRKSSNSGHAGVFRKDRKPEFYSPSGGTGDETLNAIYAETGHYLYSNRQGELQLWAYGTYSNRVRFGPSDFRVSSIITDPARSAIRKITLRALPLPFVAQEFLKQSGTQYFPVSKDYSRTQGEEYHKLTFALGEKMGNINPVNRDTSLRGTLDIDFVADYYAMIGCNPRVSVEVEIFNRSALTLQPCDIVELVSPELPGKNISAEYAYPITHNNLAVEHQQSPLPAISPHLTMFVERITTTIKDGVLSFIVSGRAITHPAEWI